MLQTFLLAAALSAPGAGIDPPAEKLTPPQSPAPLHVVARLKDGQLEIERTVTEYSPREVEREVVVERGGVQVKEKVKVTVMFVNQRAATIKLEGAKVY